MQKMAKVDIFPVCDWELRIGRGENNFKQQVMIMMVIESDGEMIKGTTCWPIVHIFQDIAAIPGLAKHSGFTISNIYVKQCNVALSNQHVSRESFLRLVLVRNAGQI